MYYHALTHRRRFSFLLSSSCIFRIAFMCLLHLYIDHHDSSIALINRQLLYSTMRLVIVTNIVRGFLSPQ